MASPKKRKVDPLETGNRDKRTANPQPWRRCDCLYFNDGNIVFIAENTAFRVHKSILALHSDVFRNMFDDVNQPEVIEVFDGCSVVRVSDESEAFETFLKALYMIEPISHADCKCGMYFIHVLRLATKYVCSAIRRQSLDAFRLRFYPDTLSAWDARSILLPPRRIISLAHDIKAEIFLPGAFYHLRQYGLDTSDLSRNDVVMYVEGSGKIGAYWPEFLKNQLQHHKEPPCEHLICSKPWRTFWEGKTFETLEDIQKPEMDPLSQFKTCSEDLDELKGVCLETKKIIRKHCDEKRMKIWNELPVIFGLGSWEKLRAATDGLHGNPANPPPICCFLW